MSEQSLGTSLLNRRRWLRQAGGAVAAASTLAGETRLLVVRAFEPDGRPAGADSLKTLLLTDPSGQPYRLLPKVQAAGTAVIELPKGRFEIMMNLPVRDFGQVYLYADNAGALYAPSGTRELLLNYEFARSRAAFVRRYVKAAQAEGVTFSSEVTGRFESGEAALAKASAARDPAARAGHANDSLSLTMWAGEMAAVERARHHITRNGPRPGFLFGCNAFGFAKSEEYARLFRDLFNCATVPFYRGGWRIECAGGIVGASSEQVEGSPDYSTLDAILEKMAGTGIVTKGHPLVWFGGTPRYSGIPEFLRKKPWADIKQSCREYILSSVGRYRSVIHAWDIINEAHDWANELGFDQQQLLELTRLAAETTRLADPTAFRVVNSCLPWGEYSAEGRNAKGLTGKPLRTPYQYLKALEAASVPYEAVGLQAQLPGRDMLEIERLVERFFVFGKPVHISELGVPPNSASVKSVGPQNVWHGTTWTQKAQADWVEQFYTICYSKPQVQAITWWDFADPAFSRGGGFLDENLQPKESYHRLKRLISSWKA